ncbi:MAG TPA: hypothetical protein VHL11_20565, partial [Phototrophicaceae bacterium]|nr:hypothetical protein [Phototrophicaceae bacterium]
IVPGIKHSGWRLIWLWLGAGLGFVLIQAKGFDTHWIPMLPPLTLLAGMALDTLIQKVILLYPKPTSLERWRKMQVTPFSAILYTGVTLTLLLILAKDTWVRAFPYITGVESQRAYYQHREWFQSNDLKPDEDLQIIKFLQKNTVPGDTLYIFGFRPEVYYLSDLRPATRFQAQFPLVASWWKPEWKQEVIDTLWAALPPYVLVLQADEMPWVTGTNSDSATVLAQDETLQDLEDWLIFNYDRQEPIGNFLVWKRKIEAGT